MYLRLRLEIESGKLAPGTRVYDFRIAEELGTSRSPIREALRRLQAEGLLIDVPRRGMFVRAFTVREVRDLAALRVVLETAGLRLARERGAPDCGPLHAQLDRMRAAVAAGDPVQVDIEESAFHVALVAMSGNDELVQAYARLRPRIRMLLMLDRRAQHEQIGIAVAKHAPIVVAFENGEPMEELMRAHIEAPLPALLDLVQGSNELWAPALDGAAAVQNTAPA